MKPNFALDLSHDGISMIHRAKAGWTLVDHVSLDAPDLSASLALLRRKAADLESSGFSCKLILPSSQILFTSMIAGGDDETRVARIREGLDGLTPYPVSDLVFDWHPDPSDGDLVHVAVVARETLAEAQNFATEHQLNPVSFVSRPSGRFSGEPFFGPVQNEGAAAKPVKRDKKPVPLLSATRPQPPAKTPADAPAELPLHQGADPAVAASVADDRVAASSEANTTSEAQADSPQPHIKDLPAPSDAGLHPETQLKPSKKTSPQTGEKPPAKPQTEPPAKAQDETQDKTQAKTDPAPPAKPTPPDLPELAPFPPTPGDPQTAPEPRKRKNRPAERSQVQPIAKPARTPPPARHEKPSPAPDVKPGAERVARSTLPATDPSENIAENGPALAFSSRRIDEQNKLGNVGSSDPIKVASRLSLGAERDKPAAKSSDPTPSVSAPAARTSSAPKTPEIAPQHVSVTGPKTGPDIFENDQPAPPIKRNAQPETDKVKADTKDHTGAETPAQKQTDSPGKAAVTYGKLARKAAQIADDQNTPVVTPTTRPALTTPPQLNVQTPDINTPKPQTNTPQEGQIQPLAQRLKASSGAQRSGRAREAESLTVFGARQTQEIGGKPKYLGLFLVLGLLLLMAIVAIWSMFFQKDNSSWLFPERTDQFEAAISTQDESDLDEALAGDQTNHETLDGAGQIAHNTGSVGLSGRQGAEPLTPEAAQARYAATGIWQRAPDMLTDPTTDQLDDLYIASIDPRTATEDAIALPAPTLPDSRAQGLGTTPPPPLGTTFALDQDGFVVATPNGALTPQGVRVFAGRPALVPAPRPGSAALPPSTAAPTTSTVPAVPKRRPRARPEGLIESSERLQLGGRTRSELAALRPRPRPATPRAQKQADAITAALAADNAAAGNPSTAVIVSPTKQAVAASIGPKARPRGFAKIVERTRKRGADASDGSVAIAAASPRQTVAPKIPTRASVAKQATIKNAINLRKVSLIGIYGSASARRALVRLPSGRYVKVKPGSRLDGGKVVSISATKLVYKKGSRSLTLQVLPFG